MIKYFYHKQDGLVGMYADGKLDAPNFLEKELDVSSEDMAKMKGDYRIFIKDDKLDLRPSEATKKKAECEELKKKLKDSKKLEDLKPILEEILCKL